MTTTISVLASERGWYYQDLLRASRELSGKLTLKHIDFASLGAELTSGGEQIFDSRSTVQSDEVILVRTMPLGSLEQVILRMDVLQYLESNGQLVLNSPKSLETAIDKYLTLSRLRRVGLPIPRTIVCQTIDQAMEGFHKLNGRVVIKPIFGGEGRGICDAADPDWAFRIFKSLLATSSILYLQEFIDHAGFDVRIFLLGKKWFAMKRSNGLDWRTNASRGARTEPYSPTEEEVDLARKASRELGTEIAGVDLLRSRDGSLYVIEVNAVPGWRALSPTINRDIAAEVLLYCLERSRQHLT